ncbi:molybdopterin-guanine dinucleotide biosynthesis protein B [Candidatus Moduliflexus flocculans]|uniref:Molybdopterin-guanine dinucleotide biosynthesis protein B n=1 Tax=Candidatus Moduliflexus flocculans TaxID=1499966 RepID=A0A0S6VQN1_9BACT|nr:molybdopterin-guanine dinucleotide biosynthesis protein B [Candidatus Moduliflexus flocculans]
MSLPAIPIVTIVGKSGSGKTTLIEKLIPEFRRRGYRIGTIKHHLHDFEIDREGKDSWRHAQAGAAAVVVASPYKLAFVEITPQDISLDALRDRLFQQVDLIIAEGYKTGAHPKIEVFRRSVHDEPLFNHQNPDLLATVTDSDIDTGVPTFGLDDVTAIVEFIERALSLSQTTAHSK